MKKISSWIRVGVTLEGVKERFQGLFDEEYHPDVYSIRATQVPRASASAVAFGLGLLSGEGKLGPGKNRAFSVLSESRASDICLRFFDSCETYKVYTLEWTDDLESFVLKGYGESINYRMGLPLLKDVLQSMEEAIIAKEGLCIHLAIDLVIRVLSDDYLREFLTAILLNILRRYNGKNNWTYLLCPGKSDGTKISQDHKGSQFVQSFVPFALSRLSSLNPHVCSNFRLWYYLS
uniref:Multiple inositol polyphosphate phosphatase 1 n=1 Tax=Oryza punctata TaxID=4537 RepID=A0A0E0K7L5_ORYPU